MMRTVYILVPVAALMSLTVLGLAVIHKGGFLGVQLGADRFIQIESPYRQSEH